MNENVEIVQKEIVRLKERIIEVEKSEVSLSETDTRQGLINPLFRACGWDFGDFLSVKSEFRHGDYNEPVDYAFFASNKRDRPILLLEAKALGRNLNDPKIVKQLCTYLGEMGVQWGALSDGNKYVMYNSKGGASFSDQKFLTLQIKTVDTEDGLSSLEMADKMTALLSRNCLENDTIQSTYEEHMVNGQIETALYSLLSTPFDTLASAVRKEFKEDRVKANPDLRISSKRIIEYLEGISDEEGRIPIDLEASEVRSDDEVLYDVAAQAQDGTLVSGGEQSMTRARRIAISDLLEDHLASEGDNWRFEYKGEVFWGRVTGNGEIEMNGELFSNPSKAGTAVTNKACCGWEKWYFKNPDRKWVPIDELRKNYRKNHGIAAIRWKKKNI